MFHSAGLSPNDVTLLGFLCIAGSAAFYILGLDIVYYWLGAVMLLLVAGYFDAIDGAMARRYKHVSKLGGVFDSILDRFGEILLYSGLALGGLASFPIAFWALAASLMVSYIRARVEVEGITLKGIGIAERPERLLVVLVAT
ncbi:MAG TPA: CDP-alcohol phosphatidyltransferase family protein, partial [Candidatus Binatus sp.]|nr:CDP-alcohol phosphatidyltransferase family protein [Candidatus Binatus sp.]